MRLSCHNYLSPKKRKCLVIKLIASIFVLSLAAGCGATNPAKPAKVYDLSHLKPANHKPMVIKRIKLDLKDPDSAKIKVGELKLLTCDAFGGAGKGATLKVWSADALVNAKNSFGAYTGDKVRRYHFDNQNIVGLTNLYLDGHENTCVIGLYDKVLAKAR